MIGRDDMVKRIHEINNKGNMSHMMFAGPKGYGKMTAAILVAKTILGDSYESNCKIVYAADPLTKEERADVKKKSYVSTSKVGSAAGRSFSWPAFIFSRIKPFVEVKPIGDKPFKILIIRDFHKLTHEQQGFRRLMEKYSSTCRMILLTDEISSIIDPILSRCMMFFFNKIPLSSFSEKIKEIAGKEELIFKQNIPKMLYYSTEGRLGESINILQKASMKEKTISADIIYKAIQNENKLNFSILLRSLLQGDIKLAKEKSTKLLNLGYSYREVLEGITNEVFSLPIHESRKSGIIDMISELDYKSLNSNDSSIQMDNAIYKIALISNLSEKIGL